MKQGEIWWADLRPTKGSEQSGQRPVVILSGDLFNHHLSIVIICPLTSQIKNYRSSIVLTPNNQNGLAVKSEILTIHIRSVSKERLSSKIGTIDSAEVEAIKERINDIIDL